jgi:HK97 family phage prohead protease
MDKSDLENVKKTQDVERRTFQVNELRVSSNGEKPTIEGYAAVFNQYSQDLGGFVEIIDNGFFDDVLDDDVRALMNHDPNYILGRTTNKTLEIKQDDNGLFQRTYPPVTEPEAVQWAKDLMVSIKRGDITQQSFAFRVKRTWRGDPEDGDEWFVSGDLIVRRLKKGGCAELLDVSPVTYPAYPQTNVSANTRSRFDEFKESLQRQAPKEGEQAQWQEPLDSLQRRLELTTKD